DGAEEADGHRRRDHGRTQEARTCEDQQDADDHEHREHAARRRFEGGSKELGLERGERCGHGHGGVSARLAFAL
ncbi:MAG: hypothetical protein ACK56I_25665, partial [bacterium]